MFFSWIKSSNSVKRKCEEQSLIPVFPRWYCHRFKKKEPWKSHARPKSRLNTNQRRPSWILDTFCHQINFCLVLSLFIVLTASKCVLTLGQEYYYWNHYSFKIVQSNTTVLENPTTQYAINCGRLFVALVSLEFLCHWSVYWYTT